MSQKVNANRSQPLISALRHPSLSKSQSQVSVCLDSVSLLRNPNLTITLSLRASEPPSLSCLSVLAPFLLHPVRPALRMSYPHTDVRTLREACATLPPRLLRHLFSTRHDYSRHSVLRVLLALAQCTLRES